MHYFFGHFVLQVMGSIGHSRHPANLQQGPRKESAEKDGEKTLLPTLAEGKVCHWNIANVSLTFLFSHVERISSFDSHLCSSVT